MIIAAMMAFGAWIGVDEMRKKSIWRWMMLVTGVVGLLGMLQMGGAGAGVVAMLFLRFRLFLISTLKHFL